MVHGSLIQAAQATGEMLMILAAIAGLCAIGYLIAEMFNSEVEVLEPRPIEVGRTLAEYRMRRLGVKGDWRNYTTQALVA